MSSNFDGIPPWTAELAALECVKNSMYNLVSTLARIFYILVGKEDNNYISNEFEFRPDLAKDCGVSCT